MSIIVTRDTGGTAKGSALTNLEMDNNLINLNTDKIQSGNTVPALTITSATINGGTITGTALNGTLGATSPSTAVVTSITSSSLTSGRVTYTSTGGLLIDSPGFTYDGTLLSVPNITTTVATVSGVVGTAATGALTAPTGTTAQRPSPASGMLRLNTTTQAFEGYNGMAWGSIGGGATGASGDTVFNENSLVVTASYTLTTGKSAMSVGPVTVAAGAAVTIPSGSRWLIL